MSPVDPFDGVAVPKELVAEFFAVFARCEQAMKEADYKRDDNGIAAPAWRRLADDAAAWLGLGLPLTARQRGRSRCLQANSQRSTFSPMVGRIRHYVAPTPSFKQLTRRRECDATFFMMVSTAPKQKQAETSAWCSLR
ncbi:hypothetical protein [Paraburkholderia nemoris]|uniref:Uncharacterized protein n=1 Tax=Paraburkholderia nemoris TaxID=2793076 RepID=A0ABM8SXW9_9BURK|nr:hypothetical protein [Paraburkholderia nemoris]CAE6713199.1 hypothetical protein R75777_01222 [Paraburkholderia nemoris]CAE6839011.1 hypothetical protein R69776_06948 [Paraburkholderia nemoris]